MLLVSAVSLGAAPKPNVLFCMADDWGWPHASAYGDPCVKTPSFDRLAQEGVLLHHVYVSSPSCTPSRNAVITGKYHWELGPGGNLWSTLPAEHESYIHLLDDAGYVIGRDRPKTWGPGRSTPGPTFMAITRPVRPTMGLPISSRRRMRRRCHSSFGWRQAIRIVVT